jgi:hypothetical protein
MKKFLALYLGSKKGAAAMKWNSHSEEKRKDLERAGMTEWMNWGTKNSNTVIDRGHPVGTTKRINPSGISSVTNEVAAYTIVQAESHEAAASLFLNYPHFMLFPGDSVEVMECLPIPGM